MLQMTENERGIFLVTSSLDTVLLWQQDVSRLEPDEAENEARVQSRTFSQYVDRTRQLLVFKHKARGCT